MDMEEVSPDIKESRRYTPEHDLYNIDTYDFSTYNRYGWAYVNGILNETHSAQFFNEIEDIKNGANKHISHDGLYMVEAAGDDGDVKDRIIYTDGKFKTPSIEKVIILHGESETELDSIKRFIYESEEQNLLENAAVRRVFEEGLFEVKERGDFESFRELSKRGRNGGNGESNPQRNFEVTKENAESEGLQHSFRVTDKETLDFLNSQEERGEYIVTFKSMQIVDGKLYSPMAAKVKGEDGKYHWGYSAKLGAWQQATEDPSNIKIQFYPHTRG